MIALRMANDRGRTRTDWLDSRHSFSFGYYHDPKHVQFRSLRVLNDDWVAPGMGFGMHPHADMEILTVVLEGALEHRDSLGHSAVIRPGEVQRMTAGRGIRHSEFNPSPTETVRLLQIWLLPETRGLEPSYEQKAFPAEEARGHLRLVASRDGRDGSVTIHQDADVYLARLTHGEEAQFQLRPNRGVWVQVARGQLQVNGLPLSEGDGASIEDEQDLLFKSSADAEILLFDLA